MEYQEVILKSLDPTVYPDKIINCKVIQNSDINNYINSIPEEEKFVGIKTAPVIAEKGTVGEKVHTTLITNYEGLDYILSEEENIVRERKLENGVMTPDIIVTNFQSTSNERYIIKADTFFKFYVPNPDGTYTPTPRERELTKVNENIIIMTAWGEPALCLKGSYIVTYNALENDFNTLEKGAIESTYEYKPKIENKLL